MLEIAQHILEALAGIPVATAGALLLIYAIYRMARHDVLLFGTVSREDDGDHQGHGNSEDRTPHYTYAFLIQNLEEVSFPGPFKVILRDRRPANDPQRTFDVKVFAGPRHVVRETVPANAPVPEEWLGQFERLPPFDTWRLEVRTTSKWVELEIDTGVANRKLRHQLIVDISPRKIGVDVEHASHQVFKGTAITPGPQIMISIVTAAVFIYIGAITLIDSHRAFFGVSGFPFRAFDWWLGAVLIGLLWLGYRRIQRPVYPIIQGYFLPTELRDPVP